MRVNDLLVVFFQHLDIAVGDHTADQEETNHSREPKRDSWAHPDLASRSGLRSYFTHRRSHQLFAAAVAAARIPNSWNL
jgi:hypothetical protein